MPLSKKKKNREDNCTKVTFEMDESRILTITAVDSDGKSTLLRIEDVQVLVVVCF